MAKNNQIDCVFIRKSSEGQDEGPQMANVENMLKALGVYVPSRHWFVGTVSRRKVRANADFTRLMDLVEGDRVGTVYVESQDRWGTADRSELFALLGTLRQHHTRLYDLRAGKDLTEKDLATELLAFVASIKSEKELQDIAFRSLRTRVNFFLETGSWPTGTHPYGYGKACHASDGRLKWVWQPVNRKRGQVFYPGPHGLTPGPANVKIPRKDKRDVIRLVPSNNPDHVAAVRLIFDLYSRVGLSRRQISARLNAEGRTFNGKPFSHTDVTHILENPAYVGDTHFGKVQTGDLHTFDTKGLIVEVKGKRDDKHRHAAERLVKTGTHEALVDPKTWGLAQKKLEGERERTSYSPRNPDYYLKQLFVCGHCGKGLTGRTEINQRTGERSVAYVCSTYARGLCNGYRVPCGYHRITHDDAERLLLDKIREMGLEYDAASEAARGNLPERLARLGRQDDATSRQWERWYAEGLDAFANYLTENYRLEDYRVFQRLKRLAARLYWNDKLEDGSFARLPVASLAELKEAVRAAEEEAVGEARRKVARLRDDHKAMTRHWAKATDEMQAVLKQDIERLEGEIREWEDRAVPLSERFEALHAAEEEREAERKRLLAEWPTLEAWEKGEALRRLFKQVTLFWEPTWHPASDRPARPRKTARPGRYSYALKREAIKWSFAEAALLSGSSW